MHRLENRSKSKQQLVNLGWNSDNVNVHVDALWKAVIVKARSPQKFMDVSDLGVGRRWPSILQHGDQSEQNDREGANLDQASAPLHDERACDFSPRGTEFAS